MGSYVDAVFNLPFKGNKWRNVTQALQVDARQLYLKIILQKFTSLTPGFCNNFLWISKQTVSPQIDPKNAMNFKCLKGQSESQQIKECYQLDIYS